LQGQVAEATQVAQRRGEVARQRGAGGQQAVKACAQRGTQVGEYRAAGGQQAVKGSGQIRTQHTQVGQHATQGRLQRQAQVQTQIGRQTQVAQRGGEVTGQRGAGGQKAVKACERRGIQGRQYR